MTDTLFHPAAERQEPEDQGAAESLPASSAQYLPSLPDPASMGLGVGTLETFDDIEGDPLWVRRPKIRALFFPVAHPFAPGHWSTCA